MLMQGFIRPFSLLLADEPFDGLDPASRDVLTEMLRTTAASGAAVIAGNLPAHDGALLTADVPVPE